MLTLASINRELHWTRVAREMSEVYNAQVTAVARRFLDGHETQESLDIAVRIARAAQFAWLYGLLDEKAA